MANRFKKGDKVICYDPSQSIFGKPFEVLETHSDYVLVKGDEGDFWYPTYVFELVTSMQDGTFTLPFSVNFSEKLSDDYPILASKLCSHPAEHVVMSHALGETFKYCRKCKQEVT